MSQRQKGRGRPPAREEARGRTPLGWPLLVVARPHRPPPHSGAIRGQRRCLL